MASRPGDSNPPSSPTPVTAATAAAAGTALTIGSVYRGVVESLEPDGSYSVIVENPRETVRGVLLAAPIFGGMLGFNIRCRLVPGTLVELSYGAPSFIHAVIAANATDWQNARNRSAIWGDSIDKATDLKDNYSELAEDLVEGEAEIGNMFGVAMQFLTTLIRMTAGDRAAVECHLINDMVRIISSQYRHFSGMGDELIFDHGRPTMERGWSSYRHEIMGMLTAKDPVAEMYGDSVDKTKLEAERVTAVGRHRLIEFVGFAGDFIHSFIADPPSTLVKMATDSMAAPSGKSWIHRNSDGTVLIQSVADIKLERVCRIPVPFRIASHEDPTVTAERTYEDLNKEFITLPQLGSLTKKDAFRVAYHLRAHSRWLSRYHAFARILQLDKEYKLLPENQTPAPSWTNGEPDKMAANAATEYYDSYACITIFRDGSIAMQDGYGSSVMLANGNIQLSAARHLDLQAAGDIRIVAGNSLYMKAQRNIEVSAAYGGVIIHGYAWLKMLCEKGSAWIRSSADTRASRPTLAPARPGDPMPELAGDADGKPTAILLEAPLGNCITRTDGQIVLMVDGGPSGEDDDTKDVRIYSRGNVTMDGRGGVKIMSPQSIEVNSGRTLAIAAYCVTTSARQMYAGDGSIIVQGGKLYASRIETLSLGSNSVRSLSEKMSKMKPENRIVPPEFNNDFALEKQEEAVNLSDPDFRPTVPWDNPSEGPKWGFCAPEEYVWDNRDQEPGEMPETLTQQWLREDATAVPDQWGGGGYVTWRVGRKPTGLRMSSNGGFGSNEIIYKAEPSNVKLREPGPAVNGTVNISWNRDDQFIIRALKRP